MKTKRAFTIAWTPRRTSCVNAVMRCTSNCQRAVRRRLPAPATLHGPAAAPIMTIHLLAASSPPCWEPCRVHGAAEHAVGVVVEDRPQVAAREDRKSVGSGKSVSVRVDLGGRRIIIKK